MKKTYHGSCECENVRYEATFDLDEGTFKCNCRMCTKSRLWAIGIPGDALKVTQGEEFLTKYHTNPIHHFCKVCGVKVFGRGTSPDGSSMAAVMLTTLDDLDPKDLAAAKVHYFDGRHDRFDRSPDFTQHL